MEYKTTDWDDKIGQFRKECPYCHSPVYIELQEDSEYYLFSCDCTSATYYTNYLIDRERNHLRNFDRYYLNMTLKQLFDKMDEECAVHSRDSYHAECEECQYGRQAYELVDEYDCWKLWDFLKKPIGER